MLRRLWRWLRNTARVCRRYKQAHGRWPNLLKPTRFTEKIQWRKLFDANAIYPVLCDKHAARAFIQERVGSSYLPECLWYGNDPDAIPFQDLTPPYFIKSSHGSGQSIWVRNVPGRLEQTAFCAEAASWLSRNHGHFSLEPGYVAVPPAIIVERGIESDDGTPLTEVKAICFSGGVASFIVIAVDTQTRKRLVCHLATDWTPLSWSLDGDHALDTPPPKPACLAGAIKVAEALSAGFDHLRVDMYCAGSRVYVGETTVYSHSGLLPFIPDEADFILGAQWTAAMTPGRALKVMMGGPPQVH